MLKEAEERLFNIKLRVERLRGQFFILEARPMPPPLPSSKYVFSIP